MPSINILILLLLVELVTCPTFSCAEGTVLEPGHGSTGRSLLQIKRDCTEDFENKNYTVITSQCQGPRYKAEACCNALKTFACPFVDLINDETNNCATTMFSYINLNGHYPPGLFAHTCREGKDGLACSANTTEVGGPANSSGLASISTHFPSITLVAWFSLFLLLFVLQ